MLDLLNTLLNLGLGRILKIWCLLFCSNIVCLIVLFISAAVRVRIIGDIQVIHVNFLLYHFHFLYTAWVQICCTEVDW